MSSLIPFFLAEAKAALQEFATKIQALKGFMPETKSDDACA